MEIHYDHCSFIVIFCISLHVVARCDHQEVCDDMDFIADCPSDKALLVEEAKFGRMRIGKCVKNDLGYLGCQNDVLDLADRWCSGKQQCRVPVTNPELNRANTACLADLHAYLEVEYTCVPVVNTVKHCSPTSKIKITRRQGYVSSHVTIQTGCGSPKAPWIIEAQTGQTIDLWLIDFGALNREHQSLYTGCHEIYGFIIERDLGVNFTMCGGTVRNKHLYKSKTNKVELHLVSHTKDASRYFVQYSFLGCADLVPPAHAWYKRQGNEAEIGCHSNDRVWRLYCNENSWDGVVGNCSKTDTSGQGTLMKFQFTFSSVILLTSVVCGAVILIIVVVVAGTVYVKKQRIKHNIKLKSDYGMISPAEYYTLKSNCDMTAVRSKNVRPPRDNQPLVHILDKDTMDTSTSPHDCACPTMTKPFSEPQPVL